jgi:RNA polymerase sigma factor
MSENKADAKDLAETVEYIKTNEEAMNNFIKEYQPFIASCVYKQTGKFLVYGKDDELSIGLMAFLEAIKSYDSNKGPFLAFARGVIRRRLIDYYRREKRYQNTVVLDEDFRDEQKSSYTDMYLDRQAVEEHHEQTISDYRAMEIADFQSELENYGITFSELADTAPKHVETRGRYLTVVHYILRHEKLVREITEKKRLPISQIEKNIDVPRKTIANGRKYIIAMVLLLKGDYPYVQSYLNLFAS